LPIDIMMRVVMLMMLLAGAQVHADTTEAPATTAASTTAAVTTAAPATGAPTTEAPATGAPTTEAPATQAPATAAPAPAAPVPAAPAPVAPAKGLTDAQQAGIAVAAVAGAGIIAGGVAASQVANGPASAPSTQVANGPASAPSGMFGDVVPVLTPVLVGSRLYKGDKPAIAAKVGNGASQGVLMGVAAFVFFGCFFLGISGMIYKTNKSRPTRVISAEDSEALLTDIA